MTNHWIKMVKPLINVNGKASLRNRMNRQFYIPKMENSGSRNKQF